jgi:glycerophosphoryl diester phosphodiesterase
MTRQVLLIFLFLLGAVLPGADAYAQKKNYYIDAKTPANLRAMFRYTGDSVSFLSSHRGGPEKHLTENNTATLKNTLQHTYSIMEIDPRYTKDSVMIVHHDPVLQRTTTGQGRVADFTWKELKKLRQKDMNGNPTKHKIQTLDKMFKWSKGKTILVLDKKEVSIQDRIRMVEKCKAEACAIVMAYTFEEAKIGYAMNKEIMMQVFIPTPEKCLEFDKTGVPWDNVVAFVAHQLPKDLSVFKMIHDRGALAIVGTSRNLDRELMSGTDTEIMRQKYNEVYRAGADILEADTPVPVSKIVSNRLSSKTYRAKFLSEK